MKEKIKFLILGILIGAVITAGVFILLKDKNSKYKGFPNVDSEMMPFDKSEIPADFKERRNRGNGNNVDSSEELPKRKSTDETKSEVITETNTAESSETKTTQE